jgi:3-methyladenine DNA glycosylase AlkD
MPKPPGARRNNGKVSTADRTARNKVGAPDVKTAVEWLKSRGSKAGRDGMARYAIPSDRAFGVAMRDIQALAKKLGRNHELAAQLWATGWYEARLLACYVDEPARVTPRQMDDWCGDFDNWAICDTVCFALFDRTAHAWSKVEKWARREEEFIKRAAFALLWGLTAHDDDATDEQFLKGLQWVERAAADDRNFVKKSVNMSLRAIGKCNRPLNLAATKTAEKLAASPDASARWVGKNALRELTSPSVAKRLAEKERRAK